MSVPTLNSLVIEDISDEYRIFKKGQRLLFLGEIVQMPGHCIVVNDKGKVLWGYHTDRFRELTKEEL